MKTIGIVSLFFALLSVILSSESGDYNELMEEKARIKAIIETKPTPGRVIFVAHSVEPKMPPSATKVAAEFEAVEATATPTHEPKPRKSKKDDHQDEKKKEKDDESEEEEEEKSVSKKKKETRIPNKKGKKSSSSESNESDEEEQGNVNGLPKRLFRPRFRADSSADTVKMFSSTTFLMALSISLLAVYFI